MEWFPMWCKALDSRKIQALPGDIFKIWLNLLMLATKFDQNGTLPPIEDIAFALRRPVDEVGNAIEKLIEGTLLDRSKSVLCIHDWNDWQLPSYSSKERTRAWRERHSERHSNVTETSQDVSCDVLDKTRLDKKERKKTPRAPRRGVVLIDFVLPDWIPENDWNDWLAMRRAKRAPTTVGAMVKAVKELDKLRVSGFPPGDVLQQSTLRCWTGVFPIQAPYSNGKPGVEQPSKPKPVITPEEEERINARWK